MTELFWAKLSTCPPGFVTAITPQRGSNFLL